MTPRPRLKTRTVLALAVATLLTPMAGLPAVASPSPSAPATPTESPTEPPTEAPTEPPALDAPETAEVGTTITLAGRNFPPETQIAVTLGEEITTDVISDNEGTFNAELTIPVDHSAETLTATATAQDGTRAETQIAIEVPDHEPTATFSTTSPTRGETIIITSKGHLAGETVTVRELLPGSLSGERTEQADDQGNAVIEYPIPDNAPPVATLNVFDAHRDLPIATELLTIRDPEPADDADADAGADGGNANADDGGNAGAGANPGDDANADSGAGGNDGAGDDADAGADGGNANADDGDDEGSEAGKGGTTPPPIDVDDWNNNDPAAPVDEGNRPNDPFAGPGDNAPVESEDEPRDEESTEAPTPVDDTTDETITEAPDTQAEDNPATSGIGLAGISAFGAGIVVLAGLVLLGVFLARRKKQ